MPSFETLEDTIWDRLQRIALERKGGRLTVLHAQNPRELPDLPRPKKGEPGKARIVIQPVSSVPLHGRKPPGAKVYRGVDPVEATLPTGESAEGFSRYMVADAPDWYASQYQASYWTRDAGISTALFRLMDKALPLRGYIPLQGSVFKVFCRRVGSPAFLDSFGGDETHFERVFTWEFQHFVDDFESVEMPTIRAMRFGVFDFSNEELSRSQSGELSE
jgi:hypothetical protein